VKLRALALSGSLALAPLGCAPGPEAIRHPGAPLVLISVDTLRSDRLPCYGYRGVATPHMDRLAADSVLFERAYSHCPLTLPSHASILTGGLPPQHGVRDNRGRLPEEGHTTLAERVRNAGYRTAGFVSSMVLRRGTGIARGFELFDDAMGPESEDGAAFAQRRGGVAVSAARRWLAGVGPQEPFFLFVHLFDPHSPYDAPEPFASHHADPYDAEIAYADQSIGELIRELEARGLYERSLIVLLSDHGEGLGDHVEREHGLLLYREALQVPLMFKLPGRERAGTRVDAPVGLVDVLPTILDMLALDRAGLPGRALFGGAGGSLPAPVYSETWFPRHQYGWSELRSLISGDLHYIDAPRAELYDLLRDPRETRNLVGTREIPQPMLEALADVSLGTHAVAQLSRQEEERLAALGYVEAYRSDEDSASLPDPKDHIAEVEEMWSLIEQIGETASAEPDRRLLRVLRELRIANEDFFTTVARSLRRKGRPELAREILRPFDGSPDPATQVLVGQLCAELGEFQEAEKRFRRATALDPRHADAHLSQGVLLARLGRPEEARRSLDAALTIDPGLAEGWNARGVVLSQAGDLRGALGAWHRAVELDPGLGDAWFNLAVLRRESGDRAGAVQALERYVELSHGAERERALGLLRAIRAGA
jgi:arylsulfatase A-like enzyme